MSEIPSDRFNLTYIFLLLHGIGFLLPWNVFINAREYFVDYKLNTTTSSDSDYRINFMSYIGFAAQFPCLLLSAWNTFYQSRSTNSNSTLRFIGAMSVEVIVLLFTIIISVVDTNEIPGIFFALTIVSIVLINCCVGIHQTLTFGIAATLPMKYSGAVILGSNVCGTIISLVNIGTKWLSSVNGRTQKTIIIAAVGYFSSAVVIVLACVVTFFWLRRLQFVRYYSKLGDNKQCIATFPAQRNETGNNVRDQGVSDTEKSNDEAASKDTQSSVVDAVDRTGDQMVGQNLLPAVVNGSHLALSEHGLCEVDELLLTGLNSAAHDRSKDEQPDLHPIQECFGLCCLGKNLGAARCRAYWSRYFICMHECWPQCVNVWCVFFCSLSIFPAIQAVVKPVDKNYFISPTWFTDVTCFLSFNFFAMLGCTLTSWVKFPGPRFIWVPIWTRMLLFVPLFLSCNFDLTEPLFPVLVRNDHVYVAISVLFAFTNGYFSSLSMMYAARSCPPERAQLAGMLAALFLIFGVFSGVYTSRALAVFVV